ncbi:hypothetical protein BH09BAC3_BH09BAC3_35320 [soil metagenome]
MKVARYHRNHWHGMGEISNALLLGPFASVEKSAVMLEKEALTVMSLSELKVTSSGIADIRAHFATLDLDLANAVMVRRLERISNGELNATSQDLNFYAHELREKNLVSQGFTQEAAYKQSLQDYGIEYKKGFDNKLYTEDALKAGNEGFDAAEAIKRKK